MESVAENIQRRQFRRPIVAEYARRSEGALHRRRERRIVAAPIVEVSVLRLVNLFKLIYAVKRKIGACIGCKRAIADRVEERYRSRVPIAPVGEGTPLLRLLRAEP